MTMRYITAGKILSFDEMIDKTTVYVDKTQAVCLMASQKDDILLTRPRRMGKSTMVSTLEYLFSKGTVGTEGLYCHEHWPEPNRYFVFHFDWSKCVPSSVEQFEHKVGLYLNKYASYFGISIPQNESVAYRLECLIELCLTKLKDEAFLAAHPELKEGDRPFCSDSVVLLIDEYDAPLSRNLDNPELFEQLLPIYTDIFSTIKSLPCFRTVFITGVSSYSQTSIFSGANQFINISLDSDYATCCGYTREEIEHYFAPELKRAQEVTNLSHDELLKAMSYFYDGYSFSKKPSEHDCVFSPVSVSLFLRDPEEGFRNYWSNTGSQSSFTLKLFKKCNQYIARSFLRDLYQYSSHPRIEIDAPLEDVVASLFPVFSLAVDLPEQLNSNVSLIKTSLHSLYINHSCIKEPSLDNAVAILFQGGYLSIKKVKGTQAYLGLANHEVAYSLATFLIGELRNEQPALADINHKLFSLLSEHEEVFERLHQGPQSIADLLNLILNCLDEKLFQDPNYDDVLTSAITMSLIFTGYAEQRNVKSIFGPADLVIFKEDIGVKVPEAIIEFKLARYRDNVIKKLDEGSKQMIDRKYGFSLLNSDPHRYCIVISNALKQVAAISRINCDGTYSVEYQHPSLKANNT